MTKKILTKINIHSSKKVAVKLFIALMVVSIFAGQIAPIVLAEPLSDEEIKALNQYPNWVAEKCDSTDPNSLSSVEAGEGAPTGAAFPNLDPGAMAKAIDKWVAKENPNSKMKGLGETIVAGAENSNVNPFLIVSIARMESAMSDPNDYNVRNGSNSFGRTATSSQPNFQGAMLWYKWSSVKASVDHTASENKGISGGGDIASYLSKQYAAQIKDSSLTDLFMEYAPPSGNDTAEYIRLVESWIKELVKSTNDSKSDSSTSGTTTSGGDVSIKGPYKPKAYPRDDIKKGDAYKGKASTYGSDPKTGYDDPDDNTPPASGISNAHPGIAIYNSGSLKGWWKVIAPNGKGAILQQTDVGPSTSRIVDINSVAARAVFDYPVGNKFPTDEGNWKVEYMGKDKPDGAITTEEEADKAGTTANKPTEEVQCCPTNKESNTPLSGSDNEEKIYNYFVAQGLEPYQAAAIMGNMNSESGFDPAIVEGGSHSDSPTEGSGFGLVQWTFADRQDPLVELAQKRGVKASDLALQLDYVMIELKGKYKSVYDEFKKSKNVADATVIIETKYEVHAGGIQPERTAAARSYLTKYGGGGASTSTGSSGTSSTSASTDLCCPPEGGVSDGSPSDWVKLYEGSTKSQTETLARGKIDPKVLVIHYTVGPQEGKDLLSYFAGNGGATGIQFNVGKDGKVYQYFPLNNMQKTNHVGEANSLAIGIEITGKDATELLNNKPQFESVTSLATILCEKYKIPCGNPRGDITGDGLDKAQGMLGHDETPTNDHGDPDAKEGQSLPRNDSSKHPYMMKLREAMGFDPTPGKKGGASGGSSSTSTAGGSTGQCAGADTASGDGTKENPVGDGPNRALALEAVKYDTKTNNGKYEYVMGGLHGPLSELKKFAKDGGAADCSGFVRYVIWKTYGKDVGSFVTQSMPSMSDFKEVSASKAAAGDIAWRSEHVDFVTENKGSGKIHQFGAHSTANDLYGGDANASDYTKFYRYVGPKRGTD